MATIFHIARLVIVSKNSLGCTLDTWHRLQGHFAVIVVQDFVKARSA